MTPTPPHSDRNPTRYDPDHSVDGLQVPPEVRRPKPAPATQDRRPRWVCLLKFLVRLILIRKGG